MCRFHVSVTCVGYLSVTLDGYMSVSFRLQVRARQARERRSVVVILWAHVARRVKVCSKCALVVNVRALVVKVCTLVVKVCAVVVKRCVAVAKVCAASSFSLDP